MSPAADAHAVVLTLTGPGGRSARFGSGGEPAATVTSSVADLVLWSTGRRSWRDLDVQIDGDVNAGTAFCDAVHVF